MSPEQKRKFNLAFGTLFLSSGLVAWGMATFFWFNPLPPKPAPVHMERVVDLQSCSHTLRTLGYADVSVQGDKVVAFEPLSMDPKAQMERATMAPGVCKLEMEYFCMGEGCSGGSAPGVTVTLVRAVKNAPAKPAVTAAQKPATNGSAAAAAGSAAKRAAKPSVTK